MEKNSMRNSIVMAVRVYNPPMYYFDDYYFNDYYFIDYYFNDYYTEWKLLQFYTNGHWSSFLLGLAPTYAIYVGVSCELSMSQLYIDVCMASK